MDILCSYCGKPIHRERYRYPSQVAMYKDKFCSTKCHDLFRNRHVEVTCCICGAKKSVKASVAAKSIDFLCSTECRSVIQSRRNLARYNSGAARIAYCETCGKEITRKPSQIAQYAHHFCSQECKANAQKTTGEWEPYGPGFTRRLKAMIIERDGARCVLCGTTARRKKDLSVHHIDGSKTNHDPSNLVTLCRSCHRKAHSASFPKCVLERK